MSGAYYYLISSLPMLDIGESPVISSEEFLESCAEYLNEEELKRLASVSPLPSDSAAIQADRLWSNWETYLRNQITTERASALNKDAHQWLREDRDVFPGIKSKLDEALNNDDPAQREKLLDQLRWNHLEGLTVGNEFNINTLVVYRIQLMIAEKWATVSKERGAELLKQLEKDVREQAEQTRTRLDISAEN